MLQNARDVSNEIMGKKLRDQGFRSQNLPDTLQATQQKEYFEGYHWGWVHTADSAQSLMKHLPPDMQ